MRSPRYLLKILMVGVIIYSCGKNGDHAENPATSPLYGSWRTVSVTVTGCADPSANHSTPDCCASGAPCCGTIMFTQTTMTYSGITASSSAYTIAGNTYHYPNDGGVPTTFTIADTVLTLSQQQTISNGNCLIVTTLFRN